MTKAQETALLSIIRESWGFPVHVAYNAENYAPDSVVTYSAGWSNAGHGYKEILTTGEVVEEGDADRFEQRWIEITSTQPAGQRAA